MIVYRVTNQRNGKVYIGKTAKTIHIRWDEHQSQALHGGSYYFHRAIRKYGPDAFKVEILYTAKTVGELNAMETFFIVLHQSFESENGYNQTMGGEGGAMNATALAKMVASKLGKKLSPEHCRKISLGNKGKDHSRASRASQAKKMRGRKVSLEAREKSMRTWSEKLEAQRGVQPFGTTWCSGHQNYLPVENFGRDRSQTSGRARYCLVCRRSYGVLKTS